MYFARPNTYEYRELPKVDYKGNSPCSKKERSDLPLKETNYTVSQLLTKYCDVSEAPTTLLISLSLQAVRGLFLLAKEVEKSCYKCLPTTMGTVVNLDGRTLLSRSTRLLPSFQVK